MDDGRQGAHRRPSGVFVIAGLALAVVVALALWGAAPVGWGVLVGAVVGAGVFTVLAFRAGWLDAGGATAAGVLALAVMVLGGWAWAVPSLAFFVSASALSRVGRAQKADAERRAEKGHRRDAVQVLANGGVGGAMLLGYALVPSPIWYAAFLGAFAAAAADTWGTELGTLARSRPRLLTTGRRVPAGTSGAVSAPGTLATLAGAVFVAICAAPWAMAPLLAGVASAGVAGAFADSLAGATVQAHFRDLETGAETERGGGEAVLLRGWRWLRNDAVNGLCTATGAGVAAGWAVLMG